ncbi:MAG: branched-chain amino acid ABC transporter permease [Verrucomicrobiaceae bacterium]|nr:MAG: branched-chain amino acid ABC transporter permease [Verrucomicrobiaceae bacterium]
MSRFLDSVARCRWALPALVSAGFAFVVACEFFPILNDYSKVVLITVGINIILCASLNLVNGYMGEFSVGHAGFMALGAYASALMTIKWLPASFFELPMGVLFGGVVAALIGFPLALLSFKTRGDYLAIITLAFLMIVKSAIENISYLGGPRGMTPPVLTTLPWTFFWVVVTLWVIRNLVYSKFGRAITAIREDEIAANAMGVRVREAKILAFVTSSFFGGVAGALYAQVNFFIDPKSFDIVKSTEILVMVYLGGIASLGGSIIGAVIFTILLQVLQPLGTWRMVILPLILVLLMLFRPRGIMGMRELPWFVPARELFKRLRP